MNKLIIKARACVFIVASIVSLAGCSGKENADEIVSPKEDKTISEEAGTESSVSETNADSHEQTSGTDSAGLVENPYIFAELSDEDKLVSRNDYGVFEYGDFRYVIPDEYDITNIRTVAYRFNNVDSPSADQLSPEFYFNKDEVFYRLVVGEKTPRRNCIRDYYDVQTGYGTFRVSVMPYSKSDYSNAYSEEVCLKADTTVVYLTLNYSSDEENPKMFGTLLPLIIENERLAVYREKAEAGTTGAEVIEPYGMGYEYEFGGFCFNVPDKYTLVGAQEETSSIWVQAELGDDFQAFNLFVGDDIYEDGDMFTEVDSMDTDYGKIPVEYGHNEYGAYERAFINVFGTELMLRTSYDGDQYMGRLIEMYPEMRKPKDNAGFGCDLSGIKANHIPVKTGDYDGVLAYYYTNSSDAQIPIMGIKLTDNISESSLPKSNWLAGMWIDYKHINADTGKNDVIGSIGIWCSGSEDEFLPRYNGYFKENRKSGGIEILSRESVDKVNTAFGEVEVFLFQTKSADLGLETREVAILRNNGGAAMIECRYADSTEYLGCIKDMFDEMGELDTE